MSTGPRTLFFLSDFGTADAYVGVVEGVIARLAPNARVVHLTHGVPPQDLRNGAWQLYAAAPHLPGGSIVLAVVDPGVGSNRRAVVVETANLLFVAPDNGLLDPVFTLEPPHRAYALENPGYRLKDVSSTFHGRDVFGPAAAHLSGSVTASDMGPAVPVDDLERLGVTPTDGPDGEVWTFDRFGNAITTLRAPEVRPSTVTIAERAVPFVTHYAAVPRGELLALEGSSGLIEVSVREGSARERLGLRSDVSIPVRRG
ncbi:MAG TPA: SAM-dependent chlorinase/fluorinase [Sandaracinaceae bacterium LLY-WYZ-13_1]|nr:SAM-dependent chlorinase/fluorinase [Sandaracinaceae bacterium LLY-WYZ-13_1]